MFAFNLKLSRHQQAEFENQLLAAEAKGDLSEVKRIPALLILYLAYSLKEHRFQQTRD